MTERGKAIVFGGTGFLGRRVVQCLHERDFSVRVASRHPERTGVPGPRLGIKSIYADINDDRSVADALANIGSAVNAVSLYAESGQQTFHSVHVTGAARVARLAREARVRQLIHVSGIGSDAGLLAIHSQPRRRRNGCSRGLSSRGAHPPFRDVRAGDAFVTPVARMLRRLPIFPLFGRGQTSPCRRRRRGDRQGDTDRPAPDVL